MAEYCRLRERPKISAYGVIILGSSRTTFGAGS